jgi:hypothetical protein
VKSRSLCNFLSILNNIVCSEIIAVCSENHTKIINAFFGQNEELVNVKADGTYNYH